MNLSSLLRRLAVGARWGIVLAVTGLGSVSAFAQVLWQQYTVGMSYDAVRKAAPAAELVDNPKAVLKSGAVERLAVPGLEIVGRPFVARFYFLEGKLTDIHVGYRATEPSSEGARVYGNLAEVLRSKYGPELSRDISPGRDTWIGTTTWSAGQTTIALFGAFIGGNSTINVAYGSRLAKEAGKL